MPAKVVDASVMAAWCFREPRASEAMELLRESELYAPLLLAYELTSIARKKAIEYPEKAVLVTEALRTALTLPIHWSDVNHVAVMRLALDTGLTTCDACYLYVARYTGAYLATFDERLARVSHTNRA
jgi:predicted nucleic acid-binding protein